MRVKVSVSNDLLVPLVVTLEQFKGWLYRVVWVFFLVEFISVTSTKSNL